MYVAVMGYGVVGSGVVELFGKNHGSIVRRSTQTEMEIRYILDLRDFPGDPNEEKFTKDFQKILQDEEVKIVVETMGGLHPAYEYVLACLKAGKSVVTSNKELVAAKGTNCFRPLKKTTSISSLRQALAEESRLSGRSASAWQPMKLTRLPGSSTARRISS